MEPRLTTATREAHASELRQRWGQIRNRLQRALPFASGVLAALLALWLYGRLVPAPEPLTLQQVNDSVAQALASATAPPALSAQVYQVIQPSLVLIESQLPGADGEAEDALGSGVIVDINGSILTALHVVDGAEQIQVTFADGTQAHAIVTATQPENDIAVLSTSALPELIVPATLGNPGAARVGDEAFVMGNPLGLYGSLSAGVISGLNRSVRPVDSERSLEGLIQFDAAANPGNSGGPLLNRAGQVIGIVTGIVNPTDQDAFAGIGFAVPINVAGTAVGLPQF